VLFKFCNFVSDAFLRVRARTEAKGSETMQPTNDFILASKREAARLLCLSVRTIDNLIRSKELTARRVGRRVLVPRAALEAFARRDHKTLVRAKQPSPSNQTAEADAPNLGASRA
jgi:excisionase family DNA binding protein